MKKFIGNDWDEILAPVFKSEKYQRLHEFLKKEYATKKIYPDMYHIFTAFKLTSFLCKTFIRNFMMMWVVDPSIMVI